MQQITIHNLDRPIHKNFQNDIEWMCRSFGLSSGRDTELSAIRIVSELLERFTQQSHVKSEMIAEGLGISSGIVNHHVRNLADSGMLYREKKMIVLRGGSLRRAVEEMRKDTNRIFDEIEIMALEIDDLLGIRER